MKRAVRAVCLGVLAGLHLSAFAIHAAAATTLPDLGSAAPQTTTLQTTGNGGTAGLRLEDTQANRKVILAPEYSDKTGASLGAAFAWSLGDSDRAAFGVLLNGGARKAEVLLNAGLRMDAQQRLILTAGQLRQNLDHAFASGAARATVTQNTGALSYQWLYGGSTMAGSWALQSLELNAYAAKTDSVDLEDKTYAINSASSFELWNDPRRIAGSSLSGFQGRLGFVPLDNALLKLSLGGERRTFDQIGGSDGASRLTSGVEWQQRLDSGYHLRLSADSQAAQNRYALGVERALTGADGRQFLGVSLIGLRGKDGVGNENQLALTWRYALGGGSGASSNAARAASGLAGGNNAPSWPSASLLDEVTLRPSFVPTQATAKIDATGYRRLIVVDKTSLPSGTTFNAATGAVTAPVGVAITGIASVTRNGAAFTNSGQFSLSGNSLVITPSLMIEPAAGVQDTYVVTVNNTGGGTTLITVKVSKGSVKIDSITVAANSDTTAPSKTSENLANLNAGGGSATGSITFDEAVAQVTSVSFKKTSDNSAVGGTISVSSGLNTTTLNLSWTAPNISDDVYIQIVVKDAANNSRTINTNNYTLF